MDISITLIEDGKEYIANCPELDINCYGSSEEEATRRIKEVINFYIDSAKEFGVKISPLKEWNGEETPYPFSENRETIN